ncbi:trypsin-like peptidase domain-containing protein [Oleiagrimonas sp.]|jgi:serine protease DegQ|uniref:S1C family serine protease n=1 Tax=Oleiagrimonas sp. TaxID=2010330 RepID=UPI00261F9393|nr:trypsin-like peptidase domain-containing protein [Oleiagrimonas sp.]MDA3914511.1 trypsin-like peptidase domain-containing protein [Oleiagrimonas sp.]
MKQAVRTMTFIAQFVVIGLAMAFVIALIWPQTGSALRTRLGMAPKHVAVTQNDKTSAAITADNPPANARSSYADAVQRAAPSVVNIYANRVVSEQPMQRFNDPLMQQMLGDVPIGPVQRRREQNLGSGVILGTKGYVLTNNHVIAGAQNIQVLLYDGRVAEASVVGSDPDTDLAVLKVDVGGDLPAIHIASHNPQVGDVVLAIGNPFGIGQTVTMGIISAINRQLNALNPEQFIQTDAAINFGNSGGALVNAKGNLVGINTALLGRSSGAEGIGFAIPVATAKNVLDQIIAHGHVIRGWLGLQYTSVPISANSGLPPAARGVWVTDVYPGSPAAQAGIRRGDVLLQLGKHDIVDPGSLRQREASLKPGTKITISGLHNGSSFTRKLTVAKRPPLSTLGVPAQP